MLGTRALEAGFVPVSEQVFLELCDEIAYVRLGVGAGDSWTWGGYGGHWHTLPSVGL